MKTARFFFKFLITVSTAALFALALSFNSLSDDARKYPVCAKSSSPNMLTNTTRDFVSGTWTDSSFKFDATDNIFVGDTNASNILNNAIVGSNKKFCILLDVKRLAANATQVLFCRDNSSTNVRQISLIFTSTNTFQVNLFTNSSNKIAWASTATFTELREWNRLAINYDGTQSATNRISVTLNNSPLAGSTTQTGTFTTINNTNVNPVEIGGRSNVANYSSARINTVALFDTLLSTSDISRAFNDRVPFDYRTDGFLSAHLKMYMVSDKSSAYSTNWIWSDIKGTAKFTSIGMAQADLYADAPAVRQVSVTVIEGQSNANGRDTMTNLPSRFAGTLTWIKIWNGTSMVNISSTANNNQYIETGGNSFGIEYFLGENLNLQYNKTIYIFKVAQGGSSLDWQGNPDWATPNASQPAGGTLWQRIRTEIDALKNWELDSNYTIIKIRIVRMQGEKDSQHQSYANAFQANWTNYLTGAGSNSMIAGKWIPKFYIQPYVYDCLLSANQNPCAYIYKSNINQAKITVAATNTAYYRTINTDNASVKTTDPAHFNTAGNDTVGNTVGRRIIIDGY